MALLCRAGPFAATLPLGGGRSAAALPFKTGRFAAALTGPDGPVGGFPDRLFDPDEPALQHISNGQALVVLQGRGWSGTGTISCNELFEQTHILSIRQTVIFNDDEKTAAPYHSGFASCSPNQLIL